MSFLLQLLLHSFRCLFSFIPTGIKVQKYFIYYKVIVESLLLQKRNTRLHIVEETFVKVVNSQGTQAITMNRLFNLKGKEAGNIGQLTKTINKVFYLIDRERSFEEVAKCNDLL